MKVAALQVASGKDLQNNMVMACEMIEQAAKQGAGLIVLPENFLTLGLRVDQQQKAIEPYGHGPIQQQMQSLAKKHRIWLVAGTLLIQGKNERPHSATLVYNPQGECVGRYNKMHMFDVVVENKEEYKESDIIAPGDDIVVVDTPLGKLGLAICYDLRFPELFRALMLKGAEILLLPSAFTVQTGKAHWEVLIRARAIENLCYVIAPGECGHRHDGRPTYGHSMIVGPWGDILASANGEPSVIVAEIDLLKLAQIRQQFPSLKHIRKNVIQALANEVNE
ncbi:MAG: carbon-nitrogen hydrolase family protein [Proteobacteria bacterium]|nr:carbon-nitrogen hydrolase family protein [Pseudomonadota bacterium]